MQFKKQYNLHYILRTAVVMCFIGHGAFGIITKAIWCNYFAVVGIDKALSYQLMPIVGSIDIILGLIMLFYPVRAIAAWLIFWGVMTASLRPLSGEPFAELVERAGNYGVPVALLLLHGIPNNVKGWFTRINPIEQAGEATMQKVFVALKWVVFLVLLGHGWLNMIEKKGLLNQYAVLGYSNPASVAQWFGMAEIAAAFTVLIKPLRSVLLVLFVWKMATELLYPSYGLFEWIERGGSYGAILALWMLAEKSWQIKSVTSFTASV